MRNSALNANLFVQTMYMHIYTNTGNLWCLCITYHIIMYDTCVKTDTYGTKCRYIIYGTADNFFTR